MNGAGIWPPDRIAELRELAATGLSAAAIGEAMGTTKNGIVGKCRRAGIPLLMPNYMDRRTGEPVVQRPREPRVVVPVPVATLPPLASAVAARRDPPRPKVPPQPVPAPAAPEPRYGRGAACQWILNEGRPWKFCGKPAMAGRPYCEAHARKAWVRRSAAELEDAA